ncbi:hypothetical protein [Vibrio spartinae]|uniref:Uncharacterized protein n=1 Tax=Vibrio spartinae TaxID=1918945 RepID=A0ABX6R4B4_9VIBR|nr:hypothetical protein [Vibrio spartinae]QMV16381.1 hypothetical protein Vspart_03773 [Vibrio spartinae]
MFNKHYVLVPSELEIETFRSPETSEVTATEREELVRQAQETGMQQCATMPERKKSSDYKRCA